jgi:glycosyltransferase 2 family protein
MNKRRWILIAAVCILLAGFAVAMRRVHFDWAMFWRQLHHANPIDIVIGIVCIYLGYIFRAVRWSVFLRPQKPVPPQQLIGTQVVGFTAVAIFGRAADLARPYLVAKRVNLSVSSQIAVYVIERMFDAVAMALIFSSVLALAPDTRTLPHHEAFSRAGWLGLIVALAGALFAVVVRLRGESLAVAAERALHSSPKLAVAVRDRILSFREGLNALRSFGDFVWALLLSLAMWGLIIGAYFAVVRAFSDLAMLNTSRIMLMMAASMGGSIVQLPVIGWFTQIGVVSAAMKGLGAPLEPSIGCAALLQIVTFLSVIPLGLIFARVEGVSLRKLTEESEQLEAAQLEIHGHPESAG